MVQEALEAGAIGFLLKDVSIDILGGAIRSAAAGQSVLSEQATQALIQKSGGQPKLGTDLSSREREVLALVAEGLNNTEIADQLVISPNTVRNHVSTCTSKLGASNRAQAAVLAMKNHLISESRDSSYR
ncbi:MAG: response regulator transcription factor [Anaerolineae bacterium]|nr:response regulator transcription factor [Anaerolineae bacterium]